MVDRPSRRRRGACPRLRRLVRWAAIATAGFVALVLLAAGVVYASVDLPSEPESAQTTVVLDVNGERIAELHAEENREDVDLAHVAPVMRQAVLAAEDRGFYHHSGLSPFGIARALVNDVRGGHLQGGSTITQQLVKNTYLTPERSLTRKVREAVLAVKVERRLGKDEILERYLNTIYFGRGAYGIEVAARTFFDTHAADLTLPQAALLAGLIRAPESADPVRAPETALRRRALVLDAMVDTGDITDEEADAVRDTPLDVREASAETDAIARAGGSAYFVEAVRRWAVEQYGERIAYGGGLRIQTTLDPRLQQAAEAAVNDVLGLPEDPAAALVAMDDHGAVRAMVGGRDFRASNVNLAMGADGGGTGRQAGSTFKPFVLAAAIEAGIPVSQRFPAPSEIEVETEAGPYEVHNYDDDSYKQLDLVDATAKSVNTVYAQLLAEVGIQGVIDAAQKAGIESTLPEVPAVALGAAEVSPLEMIRSYMTFATRGERVTPFLVDKVTDASGRVLFASDGDRDQAMPRQHADLMNHVLRQVPERGTARAARIGRPIAGKTGTTQDYGDAWFVGYTPKLGAAVWMGYPEGQSHAMTDVHGRKVTGGSFPAEIWQRFMSIAVEGLDTGDFEPPPPDLLEGQVELEHAPSTTAPPETTTTTTPEESTTTTSTPSTTTSTTPASTTTSTTVPATTTTTTPTPTTVQESSSPPTTVEGADDP